MSGSGHPDNRMLHIKKTKVQPQYGLSSQLAQHKARDKFGKGGGMSAGARGSSDDFKQQLGKIFSPLYYHSKPSILSGNSLHYLQQADFYLQFQSLLQQWHPLTGQKHIFSHFSKVVSICAGRHICFPCCSGGGSRILKDISKHEKQSA